jgi:predicted nucleotidyltransferase
MTEENDIARATAIDFTTSLANSWHEQLGSRVLGIYLIGSLAHGGFNRRYSDVDMAIVSGNGLDESDLARMRSAAANLSPELAGKLSIFWANPEFSAGRFPPLDRLDLIDHGKPLIEIERTLPARPTRADIHEYLRGAPFETWADNAERFAALRTLEPENHKPYLRAHLYPARLVYSWLTGQIASNDVAVSFLGDNRPDGLDVDLIARAMACREAARDPDMLFADRDKLPDQVGACARLIAGTREIG